MFFFQGDLGSPLVYEQLYIGILSHYVEGNAGKTAPIIYTNVNKFRKFINLSILQGREMYLRKLSSQ